MSATSVVRCSRCGHVLTDPVSKALRMGPECRGESKKPSRRQVAFKKCVSRGTAFSSFKPVVIGNITYIHTKAGWENNLNKRVITDAELRSWMEQNRIAVFPEQYRELLNKQREKIVSAMNISPTEYAMSAKERKSLLSALGEIEAELRLQRGSRTLVVGHGSKPWSVDDGRKRRRTC